MLVELAAALVLIKHGEFQLLDLLEVVVHLELDPEDGVQVINRRLRPSHL